MGVYAISEFWHGSTLFQSLYICNVFILMRAFPWCSWCAIIIHYGKMVPWIISDHGLYKYGSLFFGFLFLARIELFKFPLRWYIVLIICRRDPTMRKTGWIWEFIVMIELSHMLGSLHPGLSMRLMLICRSGSFESFLQGQHQARYNHGTFVYAT